MAHTITTETPPELLETETLELKTPESLNARTTRAPLIAVGGILATLSVPYMACIETMREVAIGLADSADGPRNILGMRPWYPEELETDQKEDPQQKGIPTK